MFLKIRVGALQWLVSFWIAFKGVYLFEKPPGGGGGGRLRHAGGCSGFRRKMMVLKNCHCARSPAVGKQPFRCHLSNLRPDLLLHSPDRYHQLLPWRCGGLIQDQTPKEGKSSNLVHFAAAGLICRQVIKFSGDALTIYFQAGLMLRYLQHTNKHVEKSTPLQAVDDTKHEKYNHVVPPHGTWGSMLSNCQNQLALFDSIMKGFGFRLLILSAASSSRCCSRIRLDRGAVSVAGTEVCPTSALKQQLFFGSAAQPWTSGFRGDSRSPINF